MEKYVSSEKENQIKREEIGQGAAEVLTPDAINALLSWYRVSHRALPWRETKDPYRIWVSEIMLQQTRVEAVRRYFARFLEAAPDPEALAALDEGRLYKLWEGLGYYSRARNLQRAARQIAERHGGVMPRTYGELRALSGIGDYTAGAIASIAYDERVPAVDGNVLRVLSRLTLCSEDISKEATKKAFAAALAPLVPAVAGDFTQALIELGATVCVPNGEARCDVCPMRESCRARQEGRVHELPVKGEKKPRRIEQKTVLLIRDGERLLLGKRPPKGLLASLFEIPNVEGHLCESEVLSFVRSLGLEPSRIRRAEDAKHIFTHIEWHMIAYEVSVSSDFDGFSPREGLFLVNRAEREALYAIPSAFSAYLRYL